MTTEVQAAPAQTTAAGLPVNAPLPGQQQQQAQPAQQQQQGAPQTQVETPPAQQQAAQQQQQAADPKQQEQQAKTDEPGKFGAKVTYNATGNTHLDLAVKFFGDQGLDIETLPGYAEAGKGDFSIIKAHLATLGIPGAEAYVALAETGLKALNDAETARTQETQAMILEADGGDGAQWADALEWLRGQTEDAEGLRQREDLNRALAGGGLMAKLAVDFILGQYRGQAGVSTPQRKSAVSEQASAAQGGASYALSQRDYQQAVEKLRRDNPGQELEGSNELNALRQRRQAGMRAGK